MNKFFKIKNFINDNKFLIFITFIGLFHYLYSKFDYNFLIIFIVSCLLSIFIDKVGHVLQYVSILKLDGNLKKTRLKLLISEKKFRDFFNISCVPMGIFNLNTSSFTSTNKKFCEMLGYSERELTSKNIYNFIHKEDVKDTKKRVSDKIKVNAASEGEFTNRYISKNGDIISITWTATTSYDGIIYCIAIKL